MLKIQQNDSTCFKNWTTKHAKKKSSFQFYFFSKKKSKNWKMSVLFIFFKKKKKIEMWNKNKNEMSRIKRCCWKNDDVKKKMVVFSYEKCLSE